MRVGRLTILLMAVATFTTAGLTVAGAANASPTADGSPATTTQADSSATFDGLGATDEIGVQFTCYTFWQHSGHTANVRWYHCHPTVDSPDVARVHICGYSGTLHGLYVGNLTGEWRTNDHKHDDGGEGC